MNQCDLWFLPEQHEVDLLMSMRPPLEILNPNHSKNFPGDR